MYVNFFSTYSDKKSCHTSTTLQTSIARSVSDRWGTCWVWHWRPLSLHNTRQTDTAGRN